MTTNKALIFAGLLLLALGGWFLSQRAVVAPSVVSTDCKNATFRIEGQNTILVGGRSEVAVVPGSASTIVTQYFGNEASGDINGDGILDVACILTQQTGGTGTFYYVAGVVKTSTGYDGTDAVLLGDRIAPQTTDIRDGKVIVNYAVRAAGEPITTQPSVGKTLVLKLDAATLQFGEVVQNFEGEADPSMMTLTMQTWRWDSTLYSDGTRVTPKKSTAFTLTLKKDGTFSATTDCNSVGGNYSVAGNKFTFDKMISTLMYCDGSQEADFTKMLGQVQTYLFTSKGELVFALKLDTGTMTFR